MDTDQVRRILEKHSSRNYIFKEYDPDIITYKKVEIFLNSVSHEFNPKLCDIHNLAEYAKKVVNLSDAIFICLRNTNEIIGIAVYYLKNRIDNFCHLTLIAVKDIYREEGLAKKLIKIMEKISKEEQVSGILTQTWSQNKVALNFYVSNGFVPCVKEKRPNSDDYSIKLKLEL
jgi:ribosomal protein S18 acetylase RimI-like enzyme